MSETNEIKKPYQVIKIDKYTKKIQTPNLLLMNRACNVIGKIPKYDDWNISLVGNGIDEISFTVPKYVNGVICPVWDSIEDLKIVEVQGFGRFEISVDYTDNTQTTKSVSGQSLEVELAQISLYEFHVNDDDAMTMVQTEYNKDDFDSKGYFIPTAFYKPSDEKHSLLHRVLADKAPHWSIGYVTPYVALDEESQPEEVGTFQRTYTSDGTSIYDLLTGDIAEESNVIFIFDTMNRQINCYSLCDCIDQSTGNIMCSGIGKDTNILLSKNKLSNEISISSNKDEVKNCFRVEGGDDTITAMVAAVNMNGSNYIYQFADFQYNDMSEDLAKAIKSYQNIMSDKEVQDEYYGENGIYTKLCEKYDELAYYQSSMMPSVELEDTTAEEQYNNIVSELKSMTIGVSSMSNYDNKYFTAVTNNVIAIAEVLLDSRYEIEVIDGTTSFTVSSNGKTGTWKGNILITRTSDETEYYPRTGDEKNQTFNVTVNDDELTYEKQKIQKALAKADMTEVDFNVADMDDDEIRAYFDLYSLSRLEAFAEGYNTCLSTLMSIDESSDIKKELYSQYQNYYSIVTEIQEKRQAQVDSINDEIDDLLEEQKAFQKKYDFQTFLNNLDAINNLEEGSLYKEFCAYRREDSYKNEYYISDGKSTSECLEIAKNLIEAATKEAKKACVLQRTISTNLNNLFALPEFEPFYDKFALFNYIRVRTDDEILKLRLIGVDFSGDSIESINVTFSEQIESVDGTTSDLTSILQQASSMATSYSSTALQAKKGETANSTFNDLYNNGLNTANIMLTNSDDQEITLTRAGLICKKQEDEGYYSSKQFRLCNNVLGFTTDNWKSTSAALGELLYTDPVTGEKSWKYGLCCEALVGKLLVGENLYIGNSEGSVQITGDGITITNGKITWGDDNVNSPTINDIPNLSDYMNQVDGRIQTYNQTTDPRDNKTPTYLEDWGDDSDHTGDIWINPSTGITKQFILNGSTYAYEWVEVTDSYLESLAKSKAQIFTAKPTVPYFEGDMIVPNKEFTVDSVTYLAKKGYRALKNSTNSSDGKTCVFSNSDWDALDYTNDDAINNFITGDYADTIEKIGAQIDGKARAWYQSTDPSKSWDTTEDHDGDLWYDTTSTSQNTYIYDGTNKKWLQTNVPKAVFDEIDGKRQIFVKKPSSTDTYMPGDLWVISSSDYLSEKDYITVNGVNYKEKTTLIAVFSDVTERKGYKESDWTDISTQDGITALDQSTQALNLLDDIANDGKITPSEKQQLLLLWNNIKSEYTQTLNKCVQYDISTSDNTYYSDWNTYNTNYDNLYKMIDSSQANSVLSSMSTTTDSPSNFSSSFSGYYTSLETLTTDIELAAKNYAYTEADKAYKLADTAKGIADNAKNIGDALVNGLGFQETEISNKYIISPVIAGGTLLIGDKDGTYAQITTDGVLNAVGANIKGSITATSLDLSNCSDKISTSYISGLSTVATSGSYNNLSDKPTIPSDIADLADKNSKLTNIVYKGDITSTSGTDSNGNTYITHTVPNGTNGTIEYTTYDTGDYILTNVGVGTGTITKDNATTNESTDTYACISKDGLLTANNAVIRGSIYATNGYFTGDIQSGSTITCGDKFKVTQEGKLTATDVTLSGTTTIISGTRKVIMDNNSNSYYVQSNDGNSYINAGKIYAQRWGESDEQSILVISAPKGIAFQDTDLNSNKLIDMKYYLNLDYDWAGNGCTHNFYGSTYFYNDITVNSNIVGKNNITSNGSITATGTITANAGIKSYAPTGTNGSHAYFNCNWADGLTHAIMYRDMEGYDTYIGWTGKSSDDTAYTTKIVLRGDSIRLGKATGTVVTSDERLKNSFKALDEFDNTFLNLEPIAFKYNNGKSGRYHFGFKAQNVKEVLENNGYTTQDFGGFVQMSDNPNNEDYCGVDDPMGLVYTEFISWNTHMIQKLYKKIDEQQATIEQQQTEIDTLKEQVSFLLSKIS